MYNDDGIKSYFFSVDFLFKKPKAFDLQTSEVTPEAALVTGTMYFMMCPHGVHLVIYSCLHLSTQCPGKHLLSTHHFLSAT